jgi:3-hydroxyisobutyrate dehydrogenase
MQRTLPPGKQGVQTVFLFEGKAALTTSGKLTAWRKKGDWTLPRPSRENLRQSSIARRDRRRHGHPEGMEMRVGYIGLGAMGGALARHFVASHQLTVLDLNVAIVAEFAQLGARPAATPADVARNADIVLLCLPRSSDVEKVIFAAGGLVEGLAPGAIVVDQTSGIPGETRRFAARLAERGVALFDAPVSGAMATAIAGTISIIASGPKDAFARALPILKTMSPNVYHCGERVGNGQAMKTVNNMMNVDCRLATLEIAALGRKLGLSLAVMIDALNATTGRNFTTTGMLPAMLEGRATTKFALALQLKDMNQALALGLDTGVPMPVSGVARGLFQFGRNTLGDDAQIEDMFRLVETMAATSLVPRATDH